VVVRDVAATCVLLVSVGIAWLFSRRHQQCALVQTEERLRGRVSALYVYIVSGIGSLGTAISGWLCEVGGTNQLSSRQRNFCLSPASVYSCRRSADD
jgi:hypothetical protein